MEITSRDWGLRASAERGTEREKADLYLQKTYITTRGKGVTKREVSFQIASGGVVPLRCSQTNRKAKQ